MAWPVEEIPDDADLYRFVHREKFRSDGGVRLSAFTNNRGAMSVDWSKYSTPEETRQRSLLPEECGVLKLRCGNVRAIPEQTVVHSPLDENRAHADVFGEKDEEVRRLLARMCEAAIHQAR